VHDNTAPPAGVNGTGYGYVALDTLPWLDQPRSFTQLQIRVAENSGDEAWIREVAQRVEQQLRDAGRTVQQVDVPTPLEPPTAQLLPTILMLLIVLGVLALVLSGFLIINTITAILTQQTRQIGVMKAIGANTRHILALYLTMALLFGLIAVSFAVPLSMLAAYGFASFLAVTLNFDIVSAAISPTIIAIEVAAGMLVPVVAGIMPIMSAARQSVRAALDAAAGPPASPAATQGWRARLGQVWAAVSGFVLRLLRLSRPLLLSLRNTFRRRGRLIRTLSALTLAGAMFIATRIVDASVTRSLTESFASRQYDVSVTFNEPQLAARVEPLAQQVPNIASVETWQRTTGRPVREGGELGDELNVTALPPTTPLLVPEIIEGRWLLPEDERAIVVSANFLSAKEPELRVGDTFTLTVVTNSARWQDELSQWRIVGVSQEFAGPAQPAEVYVPLAALERAHGPIGRGQILRVKLMDESDGAPEQASEGLAAQFAAQNIRVSQVETSGEQLQQVLTTFGIVSTVLTVMALLMGLVGGLGLTGTMSINVLERTREIGVLRAVGAANSAIYQIIISEGLIIGLLAWTLGVLLSIPLGLVLCTAMGAAMLNTPLTFTFSWSGVWLWFLLVLVVASLASFSPARNAVRLTVREVLAYDG
jgi:putative ABC transport system permease protein